jgi:tetratricopeptide (TPR) repeat protein
MADTDLTAEPKRRQRKARPVPDTPDPIEIAMAETNAGGGGAAALLLEKQARLIEAQTAAVAMQNRLTEADLGHRGWQVRTERVTAMLRLLLAVAGAAILAGTLALIWSASRSRNVVIEPFDVPPALARQGLDGRVVAGRVLDTLSAVQAATRAPGAQRRVSGAWSGDIAVKVPQTGVSIGEIDRLLRRLLGSDTHISGDIVDLGGGRLALTVRGDGVAAKTFEGPPSELPATTARAAEYAFGEAEPLRLIRFLYQNGRSPEAEGVLARYYPRAPADQKPDLLNMWGNVMWGLRRPDEAAERFRMALALKPTRWGSRSNLVGVLMVAGREQDTPGVMAEARRAAAAAPGSEKPKADEFQYFTIPVEDWGRNLAGYEASAAQVQGGIFGSIAGPMMAYAAARLHDYGGARRHLLESDPDDRTTIAHSMLVAGLRAIEHGEPERAVAPLQGYYRMWQADEQVYGQINDAPCWLAHALGVTGRRAEAEAVIAGTGRYMYCYAARAAALESAGDRRGADAAWAATVALAPSLPFPYHSHGVALLGRGDMAGAVTRFAAAHRRGPRWADPLKYWGDALYRQGSHRQAIRKYEAAAERAPRWGALHIEWGQALWRQGEREEARAKLRAAARMDLSAADRARLRRIWAAADGRAV